MGVTLFYPLLILDALLFYVIYYHVCGEERWQLATVISLLIIGIVDWYLFRAAWQAAAGTQEVAS